MAFQRDQFLLQQHVLEDYYYNLEEIRARRYEKEVDVDDVKFVSFTFTIKTKEISEDIQIALEDKDWKTYTRLCARYNIPPIEYIRDLKENFNLVWEPTRLSFKEFVENFKFLEGISLPTLEVLEIVDLKRILTTEGIGSILLPNLNKLAIKGLELLLTNLQDLRLSALTTLRVDNVRGKIPNIELESLKNLTIDTLEILDIGFLNTSKLDKLEKLTLLGPTPYSRSTLDLRNISWNNYRNLTNLCINSSTDRKTYNAFNTFGVNSIIIGKELEILNNIEELNLCIGNLKMSESLKLDKLKKIKIRIEDIGDLNGLSLPNVDSMTISVKNTYDGISKDIRELVGNNRMTITTSIMPL